MRVTDVTSAILVREGWPTVTDRGSDRGGLSKGPITASTLSKWRRMTRPVTVADMTALTEAETRRILETWYWQQPGYSVLGDDPVEAVLYDFTVTSGERNAVLGLQRVLGVSPDGVLGAQTVSAFRLASARTVYVGIQQDRSRFVHRIALADPDVQLFLAGHPKSQLHNLEGWNNRCLGFID
jgi:lysozyme family protein